MVSNHNYCNSLLYGISNCVLDKLKKIQNFATTVVNIAGIYEHIVSHLIRLHLLPIKFRIHYKVSIMVFNCLNDLDPDYLCNLEWYKSFRYLRSKDKLMLNVLKILYRLGERAFNHCNPVVKNKLPIKIGEQTSRNKFSKSLKTHYFNLSFN